MSYINYNPPYGMKIEEACTEALKLAKTNSKTVMFHYNAVNVTVHPEDTVDALVEKWTDEYNEMQSIYRPR